MVSLDSVVPEVPNLIDKVLKDRQRGIEPKQTYWGKNIPFEGKRR